MEGQNLNHFSNEQEKQIEVAKKSFLRKINSKTKKIGIALLVFVLLSTVAAFIFDKDKDKQKEKIEKIKQTKSITINTDARDENFIKTVGTVKAETTVDVVSLGKGAIKGLFFEIGDEVNINQTLVDLYGSSVLTSYNNAQVNFFNLQNSLDSTLRITQESIRQAEIGVENAEESFRLAEITLSTTQDNLKNTKLLKEKNVIDTQDKAIIAFTSYLNIAHSALNQINYIIEAEDGIQIDGIETVIAAKNPQSLTDAKNDYLKAKNIYNQVKKINPNRLSVEANIKKIINLLSQIKTTVDQTIEVLNNTVSSSEFSETTLNSQRAGFTTLRNTVVTAQTNAEGTLSALENLSLVNKSEIDAAENAVKSAESQLQLSQVGLDNSRANLDSAIQMQEQQVISAQTSLDNAEGQLNLAGNQLSDLSIKAPIKGKVTGKFVELGAEINPGQRIAEISQTEKLKIEVNLSSKDVYRLKLGQEVILNKDEKALINSINPAADPITRKVKIEIIFNNTENKLIQGTFVDVLIPITEKEKTNPDSIFIPLKSVTITQNENFVFIDQNGIAEKKQVEIGKTEGLDIEILSGLSNGDKLITEGAKLLENGDKISSI